MSKRGPNGGKPQFFQPGSVFVSWVIRVGLFVTALTCIPFYLSFEGPRQTLAPDYAATDRAMLVYHSGGEVDKSIERSVEVILYNDTSTASIAAGVEPMERHTVKIAAKCMDENTVMLTISSDTLDRWITLDVQGVHAEASERIEASGEGSYEVDMTTCSPSDLTFIQQAP